MKEVSLQALPAAAHAPLRGEGPWHLLEEHLRSVGELAAAGIDRSLDPTWGRLAGIWHDLGKYAPDWQAFIRSAGAMAVEAHVEEAGNDPGRRRGPDHSTAGAMHAIEKLGPELGMPIAFAISGHHGGMGNREDLRIRLLKEEKRDRYTATVAAASARLATEPHPSWPPWFSTTSDRRRALEFFTRMLFSALVDADFLDTERYFASAGGDQAMANIEARQAGWPDLANYGPELDRHLDRLAAASPETSVNRLRRAVLEACRAAAPAKPGIFTLTVPTGGGKTLASLAFALSHAAHADQRRIVFALPFTSIIEQTAEVFRHALAPLGPDAVLEHHSALDPERATARGRVSSENWDAPLIVTTQVQLFESLFANKPAACRKLHNLIGSVIVLDEVQSLPVRLLEPILDVIDELASHYGVTALLMTATQPAFHSRQLGGTNFRGLAKEPQEIVPPDLRERLWDGLRRVTVHWPTDHDPAATDEAGDFWNELSRELASHQQVLAITHLKKDAQELWQRLVRHDSDALHLSAAMCAAHRSEELEKVRARLAAGVGCKLISTQVVEAGVDIDFPVVYRAMSGLESLAQSAGRCNREGRLARGDLFVFRAPTLPPRALRLNQDVAAEMLSVDSDLDLSSPEVFRQYFDRLHSHQDRDSRRIQESRAGLRFKDTSQAFRMIDEATVSIFVPFGERARRLIDRLRFAGPSREVLRQLQRYAVSVYPQQFANLKLEGAVEEVGDDSGLWALCSDVHYHPRLGLRASADASETMII